MQQRATPILVRWTIATAIFSMLLVSGCESLHRDVDPVWEADVGTVDAGEDDDAGEDCTPGESCGPCDQGQTACQSDGTTTCEGTVDLDSDDEHCGQCNNVCATDHEDSEAFCDEGQCSVQCPADDETYCASDDRCIDLDSDNDHCGQCNNRCVGNRECIDGICAN